MSSSTFRWREPASGAHSSEADTSTAGAAGSGLGEATAPAGLAWARRVGEVERPGFLLVLPDFQPCPKVGDEGDSHELKTCSQSARHGDRSRSGGHVGPPLHSGLEPALPPLRGPPRSAAAAVEMSARRHLTNPIVPDVGDGGREASSWSDANRNCRSNNRSQDDSSEGERASERKGSRLLTPRSSGSTSRAAHSCVLSRHDKSMLSTDSRGSSKESTEQDLSHRASTWPRARSQRLCRGRESTLSTESRGGSMASTEESLSHRAGHPAHPRVPSRHKEPTLSTESRGGSKVVTGERSFHWSSKGAAVKLRSGDLPPFARDKASSSGSSSHPFERNPRRSATTASHNSNPHYAESQSRRSECGADNVSLHEDVDRMIDDVCAVYKREEDIDAELEAAITEINLRSGPAVLGKDFLRNYYAESFKEGFAERVLREQINLEHLNNVAAKSGSAAEPQEFTYETVISGNKVTEAAYDSTMVRVRTKLDAVKQIRKSFLEEAWATP